MKKTELIELLNKTLNIADFEKADISMNGVQVDNSKTEIKKAVCSVDASEELIDRAIDEKVDMIFVHHGLYWGSPIRIEGAFYRRIKKLIEHDIMLYAAHLPLDASFTLGNNYTMAKRLELDNITPFCEYRGVKIGAIGESKKGYDIAAITKLLGFDEENDLKVCAFGKTSDIHRIAIISGGAAEEEDVSEAIKEKADLYITGEHSHTLYHFLKENRFSMISGGHYKTEVFGPMSVCEFLTKQKIDCKFIDIPTRM